MPAAAKYQTPWMGGGPQQATKAVTVRNVADTADATVYTSTAGDVAGTNPVNTDSAGTLTTYLAPGRYLLKDEDGDKLEITVATPGPDTVGPPVVDGSRADGTALTNLLAALDEAHVITDNTTA